MINDDEKAFIMRALALLLLYTDYRGHANVEAEASNTAAMLDKLSVEAHERFYRRQRLKRTDDDTKSKARK